MFHFFKKDKRTPIDRFLDSVLEEKSAQTIKFMAPFRQWLCYEDTLQSELCEILVHLAEVIVPGVGLLSEHFGLAAVEISTAYQLNNLRCYITDESLFEGHTLTNNMMDIKDGHTINDNTWQDDFRRSIFNCDLTQDYAVDFIAQRAGRIVHRMRTVNRLLAEDRLIIHDYCYVDKCSGYLCGQLIMPNRVDDICNRLTGLNYGVQPEYLPKYREFMISKLAQAAKTMMGVLPIEFDNPSVLVPFYSEFVTEYKNDIDRIRGNEADKRYRESQNQTYKAVIDEVKEESHKSSSQAGLWLDT